MLGCYSSAFGAVGVRPDRFGSLGYRQTAARIGFIQSAEMPAKGVSIRPRGEVTEPDSADMRAVSRSRVAVRRRCSVAQSRTLWNQPTSAGSSCEPIWNTGLDLQFLRRIAKEPMSPWLGWTFDLITQERKTTGEAPEGLESLPVLLLKRAHLVEIRVPNTHVHGREP